MKDKVIERLRAKSPEEAIIDRIGRDFNLAPFMARTQFKQRMGGPRAAHDHGLTDGSKVDSGFVPALEGAPGHLESYQISGRISPLP